MLGAIAGDIIGSIYEWAPIKTKEFPLFKEQCFFTDDTVLTVAVASAILDEGDYRDALLEFGRRYPDSGYGGSFGVWLHSDDPQPYNSWGNGSAMRVSPIGFAFDSKEDVLGEAERTAEVSHNHPEGIKGAQATAMAIWMGRNGRSKGEIRDAISGSFGYDLARSVDEIRPTYEFDESCQRTVPEAITAFLESESWEDAVRNAISLGGDSDTLACITGGIAEAFYGPVSEDIRREVRGRLTPDLWEVAERFRARFWPGDEGN